MKLPSTRENIFLQAARRGAERASAGSTRREKNSLPAILEEIKDSFLELVQKLSGPAPIVQPVFEVPTPSVTVQPERKTAWTFEIVERDSAGLIKKFTATPQ